MNEFLAVVKQYKEFIMLVVALVTATLLVLGYFATKSELTAVRSQIQSLIDAQSCQLGIRILSAESISGISRSENVRLELIRAKSRLEDQLKRGLPSTEASFVKEQIASQQKQIEDTDEELKRLRILRDHARDAQLQFQCGSTIKEGNKS